MKESEFIKKVAPRYNPFGIDDDVYIPFRREKMDFVETIKNIAFLNSSAEKIRTAWWNCTNFGKLRFIRDLYWDVMYRVHPKYKYHIVNTGLKPDYYDPDIRIAAAILKEAHDYFRDYPWIDGYGDDVYQTLKAAFQKYESLSGMSAIEVYETLQTSHVNGLLKDIIDIRGALWY